MTFTEKEIKQMNTLLDDKIKEPEMHGLKAKAKESLTNRTETAKLFIISHDSLSKNLHSLSKNQQKKLSELLEMNFVKEMRNLLEDLGDGFQPHGYITEMKIKNLVDAKRTEIDELINLFFGCFEEQ